MKSLEYLFLVRLLYAKDALLRNDKIRQSDDICNFRTMSFQMSIFLAFLDYT